MAEAALAARFGSALVARYRPYRAEPAGDRWVVVGTAANGPARGGGVPEVEVSRTGGEIVKVHLGR